MSLACSHAEACADTGQMFLPTQSFSLSSLNQRCFRNVISTQWSQPSPKSGSLKCLYVKRPRRFVRLSIRIQQAKRRRMCLSCITRRYLVRSTSTVKQYFFSPQRFGPNYLGHGKSSSLTAGSILPFFLYLLLPLGSIYICRIGAAIPVQRDQAA